MYKIPKKYAVGACTYCGNIVKVGEDQGNACRTKRSTFVYWHEYCRTNYYKEIGKRC